MTENYPTENALPAENLPYSGEAFTMAWVSGLAQQYAQYMASPDAREIRLGPSGLDLREDEEYRRSLYRLTQRYGLDSCIPLVDRLIAKEKDHRGQHDRTVATLAGMVAGKQFCVELDAPVQGQAMHEGFPVWRLDRDGRVPRGDPGEPIAFRRQVYGRIAVPHALDTNSLTVFLSPGQRTGGRFTGRSLDAAYATVWPVVSGLAGTEDAGNVIIREHNL